MITALLGLLESKQDNGCFLQKMKRRFDSCFQLEMMRGTHHSQPLPFLSFLSGRPSVADTPRCNRSFSTPYQHFFLHLSPFLLLFPMLLILSCLNPSLFFCHILLSSVLLSVFVLHTHAHTQTHAHSHLSNWVWLQSCALSSHAPLCQISSQPGNGENTEWLFALSVNSTGHTAWLFAPQ